MKHDNTITVRCNSGLKEELSNAAERTGLSLSSYMLYSAVHMMTKGVDEKLCQDEKEVLIRGMGAKRLISTYIETVTR